MKSLCNTNAVDDESQRGKLTAPWNEVEYVFMRLLIRHHTIANHLVTKDIWEQLLQALALKTRKGGANSQIELGTSNTGLKMCNRTDLSEGMKSQSKSNTLDRFLEANVRSSKHRRRSSEELPGD